VGMAVVVGCRLGAGALPCWAWLPQPVGVDRSASLKVFIFLLSCCGCPDASPHPKVLGEGSGLGENEKSTSSGGGEEGLGVCDGERRRPDWSADVLGPAERGVCGVRGSPSCF
jgi:hypothetical protein